MSLGLNEATGELAGSAKPPHKSAGLAFLVSLIAPGAGQIYCGKTGRGGITFAVFVVALVLAVAGSSREGDSASTEIVGIAIMAALVLYVFSFLDAYYVAREINAGTDLLVDPSNPRVATTLNLLTNGFGYWYLGERTKGWTAFIVLGIVLRGVSRAMGNSPWSVLLLVVPCAMAIDAYRLAHKQIEEARQSSAGTMPPPAAAETRLPAAVPIGLAAVVVTGAALLTGLGLAMPNFSPVDQSRAVINGESDPKSYDNPAYGVHMLAPAAWDLVTSDKQFLVKAVTLRSGCEVALLGQGSVPTRRLNAEVELLSKELLTSNPNFRRTGDRSLALGNLGDSREVDFVAKVQSQEVIQRYLVARKGMVAYVLITTMAAAFEPQCEKDADWIRENVRIGK